MGYYILKVLISAVIIVLVAEISKRSSLLGGLIASLPLISILAIVWLYVDTKDIAKISELSYSIFWFVIPSLLFFLSLPVLLKNNLSFWLSLFISCCITIAGYYIMVLILEHFNIKI